MTPSPKERIRDTFYMQMWDEYQIESTTIIEILKDAGFEGTFEVSLLAKYEEAVKKAKIMKRIKDNMKPIPRVPCLYPGCEGEKISYTRGNSSQWFCSEGGSRHFVVWRIARLKALSDLRNKVITEDKVGETIDQFIKEYESYAETTKKNN